MAALVWVQILHIVQNKVRGDHYLTVLLVLHRVCPQAAVGTMNHSVFAWHIHLGFLILNGVSVLQQYSWLRLVGLHFQVCHVASVVL